MDSKKEQGPVPPYVAYKTLKNFLRGLSAAIPSRIDKSVMSSMSGGTQGQVSAALRYLKLVDAQGIPQPLLVRIVKSDGAEHQAAWREALGAYPFVTNKTIDLSTATSHQLEEEFKKLASGDTVRKAVIFFIPAAKEAGIQLSPYFKEPGKRAPSSGKPRKARAPRVQNPTPTGTPAAEPAQTPPSVMGWHELLLAKFPSFDPAWPDDVKAKWFTSFADLMQKGGNQ